MLNFLIYILNFRAQYSNAMRAIDYASSIDCNDVFIENARELECEVEFVIHSKGEHEFKAFNEVEETNSIIEKTIIFIEN